MSSVTRMRRENWEPEASRPANLDGHWGPFHPADPQKVLAHTNLPEALIAKLEAHQDDWKVSIRGQYCCNCGAGFLMIDIYKPIHFPFFAFAMYTYSYQADK